MKRTRKNFPRAALRQRAFEPGEDRLHQREVEDCEGEQDQQSPGKQQGARGGNAEECAKDCEAPEGAGRVEHAVREADQKIRAVSQWEAQQVGGIRIVGEGGRHHGERLPEEKNGPQENCEVIGFALRNEVPGESGAEGESAETADREGGSDEDAREQFQSWHAYCAGR